MNREERDRIIATSTAPVSELAQQFSLSEPSIYRIQRQWRRQDNGAQPEPEQEPFNLARAGRQLLFDQHASSGITRYGGDIQEEYQRELRGDGGIKLYTQMAMHPVAAAVLYAISMAQRQVEWFAEPASDESNDADAAEFLEQCMQDMSQTWDDVISETFTMLEYGFSLCEQVYKRRLGQTPNAYVQDPARSRFDDGRIGWRRWQFISPKSLASGDRWIYDDNGRVQGFRQQPPPHYQIITVPMEKALLFRTITRWDNPEGRSVLRPMYQSWYYADNLAEVEAIAAERMGTGIPAVYLGNDRTMSDDADSDWSYAKDIVRNVRVDEQMGLVFPGPKMGGGAPEGTGWLFELVSPPSRGIIDFNQLIDRHEKRMAMTVLSQFIFLGMQSVGTQALNESAQDFFQMAISAWSDSVADVINRFAVPRLFALNPFTLEELPRVNHSPVGVPDLAGISEYINKLVGAQVITPDGQLEAHVRELAKLPEMPEVIEEEPTETPEETEQEERIAEEPDEESADFFSLIDEPFALRLRQGGPKWERSTNAYEMELRREYSKWADATTQELLDKDVTEIEESLRERVDELIALLILLGRRRIPQAQTLGLADSPATAQGYAELGQAIESNERYLTDSLGPGIVRKVLERLRAEPLLLQDQQAMGSLFGTFVARVGSYAGAFWTMIMRGFIDRIRQDTDEPEVYWKRDPQAKHCDTCLQYGDRAYDNINALLAETGGILPADGTLCNGNCRCGLLYKNKRGAFVRV